MATLQASILSSSSSSSHKVLFKANLCSQKLHKAELSAPHRLNIQNGFQTMMTTSTQKHRVSTFTKYEVPTYKSTTNSKVVEELYAIMDVVADRAEMHKNIGAQRDNWNHLLLTSINGMTIAAATMAGLAAMSGLGATLLALKLSSTLLYVFATGFLMAMNKIQPSQLAEEQRNAARLFKQLHEQIKSSIALRVPTTMKDVNDAMEKVLALDRAYPLPLLGAMLQKFPKEVEPSEWWPKQLESIDHHQQDKYSSVNGEVKNNGWSETLEDEMKEVVRVLRRKDTAEYVRLSKLALKVNKALAICGPLFTGLASIGSAFAGSAWHGGSWAVVFGVVFGALATVVNTLEHGGQVGMVFEMYRSSAGFFRLMEETIESTLKEGEVGRRENGELFEAEVALKLGRSLAELRNLATSSSSSSRNADSSTEEFASRLF
ncbi:probable F-box protein At4g22030 [Cornus florida]|uniref:probable F-box protein At4g22030 n=1 Tax=Cornus florida TaxID=4283 RepID=UPI00289FB143|nr:probable F-box protein At4g22030 [Cornus florida]